MQYTGFTGCSSLTKSETELNFFNSCYVLLLKKIINN